MLRSELQEFRKQLKARAQLLRQAIHDQLLRNDDKTYAEIAGSVLDAGEQAVADLLADARVAELRSETSALSDIIAAQHRIEEGIYGVCQDCDAEIDVQRMRAQPTAMRCTVCQTRHESILRDRTPSL